MSKKKKILNYFSALGEFVYSTDAEKQKKITNKKPSEQHIEAHFSKKGRGGKVVTVLKGFHHDTATLKQLAKELKTKLGVGGNVKDGEIIIQGNNRDKIVVFLTEKGYRVKKVGG